MSDLTTVNAAGFSRSDARKRFITGVYLWMAAALVVTAVAALVTASSPTLRQLVLGNRFSFIILAIAEIAVVWYLSARIRTMSRSAATIAFFAYAILNGLTLSVIFFAYPPQTIGRVFFLAAAMFGGMSVFGLVTKADLMKTGYFMMMALWGVIIASLVNIFLRSSGFDWVISLVTVVVFTGLTAWDSQKLQRLFIAEEGSETYTKQAIFGALQLYLDFINLFLALLRIFGNRKR
jgi:FtsH-binding integral membrane protein